MILCYYMMVVRLYMMILCNYMMIFCYYMMVLDFLWIESWAPSYVTSSLTSWHLKISISFTKTQTLLAVIIHRSNRWIMEEILFGVISRKCKYGTKNLIFGELSLVFRSDFFLPLCKAIFSNTFYKQEITWTFSWQIIFFHIIEILSQIIFSWVHPLRLFFCCQHQGKNTAPPP